MPSPPPPLELWFDFASTYSYLASEQVEEAARVAGVPVSWRPFLLGPIFQAQLGFMDSPFNRRPARAAYMWRDLERETARLGIPWRQPTRFPANSVLAARVAQVALDEPWGPRYVHAIFRAGFGQDRDIAARETVVDALRDAGAGDPDALISRAVSPEHKDRLRRTTDEALRRGIFGAPTFFVGGEMYFGNERLARAVEHAASSTAR